MFPNPKQLIENVSAYGRKMVPIVDPHLKREGGYHIYDGARAAGHLVQDKDGNEFDGWCWPGSSVYLDFTNENARSWWADQFALDKYEGSTLDLFTWNDMNEPSVFNGPEVSMRKDVKAVNGQEHREWHNLYGFYQQMATAEGHIKRSPGKSNDKMVSSCCIPSIFPRPCAPRRKKTGTLRFWGTAYGTITPSNHLSLSIIAIMVYSVLQIACKWNTCHAPIMDALPR